MPQRIVGAAIVVGTKSKIKYVKSKRKKRAVLGIIQLPEKIKAKRKQQVIWGILNLSLKDVGVGLDHFALNGNVVPAPVDFVDNPRDVAKREAGLISAVVKDTAAVGKYTYSILINGKVAVDPELEIEKPGK